MPAQGWLRAHPGMMPDMCRWVGDLAVAAGPRACDWPAHSDSTTVLLTFTEKGYPMADTTALAVVQEAWDKWVAADLDGFVKLFDPDGVWTNAGHNRVSGPRRGHAEITKVAQLVFEISGGTLKAQPIELAASDENSVLGYFQLDAERPGATIHQNGLQKWVVRKGKVVSLDNAFLDQGEVDRFFK